MLTLFAFRHGQTDWNKEGRIQGHLDIPLNDLGRAQAAALREPFRRLAVEAIISSDLQRAHETARIVADTLGLKIHQHEGLRESHLGKLQGLNRAEISQKFGPEVSHRLRHQPLDDSDITHLGAETGDQIILRAISAAQELCAKHGLCRVGVATHGGVLRRLLQYAANSTGYPPPVPNGVIYPLTVLPGTPVKWQVEGLLLL